MSITRKLVENKNNIWACRTHWQMRNTSKFRFVFTRASTYSPNVVFCCWWGGSPPPNLQFVVWGSFHPSHYANLGGQGLTRGPLKGAVGRAGADQGPSEGGSLPCCLCPSDAGGEGRGQSAQDRTQMKPIREGSRPGRPDSFICWSRWGAHYICPYFYAQLLRGGPLQGGGAKGGGASMHKYVLFYTTVHNYAYNMCKKL